MEVGSLRSSTPKRSRHPPSSHAAYEVVALPALNDSWEALFLVIDRIGRAVDGMFTGANSFWTTFFHSEMSGGLLVRPGHVRSEAEVKHELFSPLLQRVAHALSSVTPPEGWEGIVHSSTLHVETVMERRLHTPGAKPRVDYTLVGHVGP